jgi:hypothetical protein
MAVRWLKKQLWTGEFYDGKGWIVECDKERRRKKMKEKDEGSFSSHQHYF